MMTQPPPEQQNNAIDDIDRQLNELKTNLEGGNQLTPSMPMSDIMHVPELKGYLRFMK